MTTTIFKLSPSDLTFLWDECKRCFYLKVSRKFNRPSTPMPSIFIKIDGLMKQYFQDKTTAELCSELPQGVVQHGEKWVQSQPITLPGHIAQCYLLGKCDSLLRFADGTYGVVDFKTSTPKPSHIAFYGRQLHAYAYALENSAPGKFSLNPITHLGLFVVEPIAIAITEEGRIAYLGDVTWQEIPRDDNTFLSFLGEVLSTLENPSPPEPGENCLWCKYREASRISGI